VTRTCYKEITSPLLPRYDPVKGIPFFGVHGGTKYQKIGIGGQPRLITTQYQKPELESQQVISDGCKGSFDETSIPLVLSIYGGGYKISNVNKE
jgi:hypothetical protein